MIQLSPRKRPSRRGPIILALLSVLLISALYLKTRPEPGPSGPRAEPPELTIFLIDGLTQAAFDQARTKGTIPHIEKLIAEGALIKHGVAAFPSMTGYGYYPFITSRDSTTSEVLGLRWMDRSRDHGAVRNYVGRSNVQMNLDFTPDPKTMFELVAPQHTSSFMSFADRGAGSRHLNGWDFTMAKYREKFWLAQFLTSNDITSRFAPDFQKAEENVVNGAIADLQHRPKIQWITFTSPDATYHLDGETPLYHTLIAHIDSLIGRYRAASRALGLEKERIYAVITDHGAATVHQNANLQDTLEAAGLSIFRDPAVRLLSDSFEEPIDTYAENDGILLVNGNTMNYMYMRHPKEKSWKHRVFTRELQTYPTQSGQQINVITLIVDQPGVEHVASLNADRSVSLFGKGGHAIIRKNEAGLSYTVEGQDPLGYQEHASAQPLTDGGYYSFDAWLQATPETDYPFGAPRVYQLLAAENCGDLVLLAAPGWDLASDYEMFVGNYRGGHGGLRADQLKVPYILSGPGIAAGVVIPTARAEDVGATLFDLLGLPLPPSGEGQVLKALKPGWKPEEPTTTP